MSAALSTQSMSLDSVQLPDHQLHPCGRPYISSSGHFRGIADTKLLRLAGSITLPAAETPEQLHSVAITIRTAWQVFPHVLLSPESQCISILQAVPQNLRCKHDRPCQQHCETCSLTMTSQHSLNILPCSTLLHIHSLCGCTQVWTCNWQAICSIFSHC